MAPDVVSQARRAAEEVAAARPGSAPSECALSLGIEIIEAPSPPPAQPTLCSEYRANPPRILLYTRSLHGGSLGIDATQGNPSAYEVSKELHVAHELFHHLEMARRFGSLTRAESEAGAHAFARCLVRLALGWDIPLERRTGAD